MIHSQKKTLILCEGAIMIALAVVLNFIRLDLWPQGGSVDLLFIPLMVYSLRRGPLWGCGAGLIFGTIKCLIGGIAYGWQSLILDYSLAYALVGLSGFLPKRPVLGSFLGAAGCLFSLVLSGVLLWGQYMPENFLGLPMTNVWIYSLLYNGSFVLCNEILAAVALALLKKTTNLLCP